MKFLLRLIRRDPATFVLNVAGLAIGIGAFACLQVFVAHERSFDRFHENANQLHRMTILGQSQNQEYRSALVHGAWVELLEENIPGVDRATKIMSIQSDISLATEDKMITAQQGTGFYTDSDFLEVFQFDVIQGQRGELLSEPYSMVLTRSMAMRLFGRTDVLGAMVIFHYGNKTHFKVSGVLEDIPANSHLQFEYLISGSSFPEFWAEQGRLQGGSYTTYVYMQLADGLRGEDVEGAIAALGEEHFGDWFQFPVTLITAIHFDGGGLFEHAVIGNKNFVDMLWGLSMIVLLVAMLNYILLTASQLHFRGHEVAIRRTLGASWKRIFGGLLKESILLALMAGVICVVVVQVAVHDQFPRWFGLELDLLESPGAIIFIFLVCVGAGLVAGLVPAMRVASKALVPGLRAKIQVTGRSWVGSRIVVFQFLFTFLTLLAGVMVVKQLNYLKGKDLGYNREAVINVKKATGIGFDGWRVFRQKATALSSVESVGTTMYDFIGDWNGHGLRVVDGNDTSYVIVQWNAIDPGAVEALGMRFVEGRNFDPSFATDSTGVILNRAAARKLNMQSLVGKRTLNDISETGQSQVLGVVEDFHFQSFDQEIKPIALLLDQGFDWKSNFLVKFRSKDYQQVLSQLEEQWQASGLQGPFEYQFLDDTFQRLIAEEQRIANLILAFSLATLLITCLGLVGTVRFQMLRQRRSISIRKVFGASIPAVLIAINNKYVFRMSLAVAIGVPLGMYGINSWLQNFAYRTSVTAWDYLLAVGIMLVFTTAVITLQSWRTVQQNPAAVLKDE
ncbi:MAG: ABC transporter permease [Bacteroidota bacterium]